MQRNAAAAAAGGRATPTPSITTPTPAPATAPAATSTSSAAAAAPVSSTSKAAVGASSAGSDVALGPGSAAAAADGGPSSSGQQAAAGGSGRAGPEEEARGVFLRGIPVETTEAELRDIFSRCGPINRINIVQSKTHETNTAYVDFETREVTLEALRLYGAEMGEKEGSVTACRLTIRNMQVPVLEKLPPGRRPQGGMLYSRGGGDFRRGGAGEPSLGGRWCCEGRLRSKLQR